MPALTPIPLLLDTDIGDDVDDVFALLLAARQPAVRLLGVTTVYGDVAQRTRIARKLLRRAGRADIPVVGGQARTLAGRDPGPVLSSGLGYAPDPELAGEGADAGASDFLIERVMGAAEPPVLVAVGPLTNVGAALRQEPRLAGRLRALVIMGGRLDADAAKGEHNVNSDPEATRLALESGARLVLGTYDVTVQAKLGAAEMARLRASGDAACADAADMLARYLQQKLRAETAMYDPLTLTAAYTDAYLTTRPLRLSGVYGERLVRLTAEEAPDSHTHVSVAADASGFVRHLMETIAPS